MSETDVEIPRYFLCPISLEIMKDPVTLSTGITYDRDSIEKWLFSGRGNATCPATQQPLPDLEFTPNVTLRRLIQSWCALNAANGVQRLPTPRTPVSRSEICKIFKEAKSPEMRAKCLTKIQSIARANQSNRRTLEAAGAVEFLASLVVAKAAKESESESDDALSILFSMELSEESLSFLSNPEFIASLANSMKNGSIESRANSIALLNQILESSDPDPSLFITLQPGFFLESTRILKDQISQKATKYALKLLVTACPWGRNRVKSSESGTVPVLIELLLDSPEKRTCEMALTLLDLLCQCAEGRAELLRHGAGLAVVSKKILRVSQFASERAVRILHSIARFSAAPAVLQEMLQVGAVTKLCLAVQVDSGLKTQERAWEILKMHCRAWRNSPCIRNTLISKLP